MRKVFFMFLCCFFLASSLVFGKTPAVKIAYLQSDIHHLPLWVALEKKFFDKTRVKVKIAGVFKAGPEIMSAFAAKELDMAYVGEAPSTTAVANGMADVVAVAQVNTEGSALVVSNSISSIKDLVGKIVAIPGYSTVQDFLLRKTLVKNKIMFSDLKIIVIKPPEMIGALKRKDIDGFIAWEPYPSNATLSGVGKVLMTSTQMWPNHPCCVLVSDRKFLRKHKDKVKKVLKAHIMAINFIHTHPKESAKIGVKYTGFSECVVKSAMKNVKYTYKLSVTGEKEYVLFLNKFSYINVKKVNLFLDNFLNKNLLKEIINEVNDK